MKGHFTRGFGARPRAHYLLLIILTDAYHVEVDGVEQPLEWIQFNTANTGNAYFGKAVTPPIDLSGRAHAITIATRKPWCAIRRGFRLRK